MQGPGWGRRDLLRGAAALLADALLPRGAAAQAARERRKPDRRAIVVTFGGGVRWEETFAPERSEEHTSELQSHSDLVCRLLLEKKKTRTPDTATVVSTRQSLRPA